MTEVLEKLRGDIRDVDNQILNLVKRRFELAEKIGKTKTKLGLSVVDLNVEKKVIERALAWSREIGLDQNFTLKLIKMLITESVRIQKSLSRDT